LIKTVHFVNVLKAIFIIRKNSPYSGAEDAVLWLVAFYFAKFLIEVISLFTELASILGVGMYARGKGNLFDLT